MGSTPKGKPQLLYYRGHQFEVRGKMFKENRSSADANLIVLSTMKQKDLLSLKLYTKLVCNVLTFAPRDPFCIFSNPKAKTQSDEPVMVWMAQLGFT